MPSILIGVPIGAFIIQRVQVETFRRICMSFDAWVVAFGLSRLLQELQIVESNASYLVLVAVGAHRHLAAPSLFFTSDAGDRRSEASDIVTPSLRPFVSMEVSGLGQHAEGASDCSGTLEKTSGQALVAV